MLKIEVVYIPLDATAFHAQINVKPGTSLQAAVEASGLFTQYPETQQLPMGIYGKLASYETLLKDGDRIEFYRPLTLDPKEKRRRLAKVKKI